MASVFILPSIFGIDGICFHTFILPFAGIQEKIWIFLVFLYNKN